MITAVRLELGASTMQLLDRSDVWVRSLDIPHPEVRGSTRPNVDDDGVDDTTAFYGARSVSVSLRTDETAGDGAAVLDELGLYLHPKARPYLVVEDTAWPAPRRLRLRRTQAGAPIEIPNYPYSRDILAQWSAPDGVWEATSLSQQTILADVGSTTGRTYPLMYGVRTYPASAAGGVGTVINPGNTDVHQVIRLYGPCIGPRYTNQVTGETFAFRDTLNIPAGEYVEIDTKARSASYMSDPTASRLMDADYLTSTWLKIPVGSTVFRYHPVASVGAGCVAVVLYRPSWS